MKNDNAWVRFRKDLNKSSILLLMILPAFAYFVLFNYVPMAGIIIAFKKFNYVGGIFGSPWCGFENFKFFFNSGDWVHVTRNTVLYNLAFISVNTVVQIFMAIMISEFPGKLYKKFMQSAMFLPYFISWVVVAAFSYNIFNYDYGVLNTVLVSLGMEKVDVYSQIGWWKYIIVAFNTWKDLGYGTVLYLAAIMGIDQEMFEAADIDGANQFQKIWYITVPNLIPTIMVLLLLGVSRIFRGNFDLFYNLIGNQGRLFKATDVIDTYVFRALTQVQEFGMSASVGVYQSVLNLAFILAVNTTVRKIQPDYALF